MGPKSAYIEHLARVPLFSQCSKEELRRLARRTTDIRVEAGQALIRHHQGAYEFFVIVEGEAEVSRYGTLVATLGPGDFFGELALLDRSLRDATVTAVTPMEIIVMSQWDFEAAIDEAPRMTRRLLTGMARRLRTLDDLSASLRPADEHADRGELSRRRPFALGDELVEAAEVEAV